VKGFDDAELLAALAHGGWCSGETLARRFGVSRAAVWKRLQRLAELPGIEIERAAGRGYRLNPPLELLQEQRIRSHLGAETVRHLHRLRLCLQTGSTNDEVRRLLPPALHQGSVVLAEHQTAGRGRRGRQWVTTFAGGLWLSLAWRFDLPMAALAGVSLAAGVALARVLEEFGLESHRLKWPNDLMVEGRKLAGILVEASGEASGPCVAVVGVGLNLSLAAEPAAAIDQPWCDLHAHLPEPPGRNRLAGRLIDELVRACLRYQREGLTPFLEDWRARDGFEGRKVEVRTGEERLVGICRGVDESGALRLERDGVVRRFHAGEVSLREG